VCEKVQELKAARKSRVKTIVFLNLETRWSYVASRASRFAPGKGKTLLTEKESAWIPETIWRLLGQIKNLNKQDFIIQVLRKVALNPFVFPNFSKQRNAVIFKG
jgi:hypothetical protein